MSDSAEQKFIADVLNRLERLVAPSSDPDPDPLEGPHMWPDDATINMVKHDLAIKYKDGWTIADAVKYFIYMEDFNPTMPEDIAIREMGRIASKYI